MDLIVTDMVPDDWDSVRAIYLAGIATGNATFETEVPSWEAWDAGHLPVPRLVARRAEAVLGWAALSPVSRRRVYGGVAEVSVYVAEGARGQGVGRRLLRALIDVSERLGIWTLQGGVFPENSASIALQRACGFRRVGLRERLGQHHGVWRDVVLMERRSGAVGGAEGSTAPTPGADELALPARDVQRLRANRRAVGGEAGMAWVGRLPELVRAAAVRWSLEVGPPFGPLSYNFVAPAWLPDGTATVLKLCDPGDGESRAEMAAARWFGGCGAVRLIDDDPALGALLLERLWPGVPVSSLHDEDAEAAAAAAVMRGLWRAPAAGHPFVTMADWFACAERAVAEAGASAWLREALARGSAVAASAGAEVVLHGDLHHDNILAGENGWTAIDPKGVVGEPAWDVGPYLYNNLPDEANEETWRRLIRRRAEQLAAALGLEPSRVRACAAGYAALSTVWSLEETLGAPWLAKHRAVIEELS